DQVEHKGRVLVAALLYCLERSRVGQVYDPKTLQFVLESSLRDNWREGEFRLEALWRTLCQQKERSPEEIAPPLLVFKANESELGVRVRMPHALSAIPQADQAQLRAALALPAEEFATALSALREAVSHARPEPSGMINLRAVIEAASAQMT